MVSGINRSITVLLFLGCVVLRSGCSNEGLNLDPTLKAEVKAKMAADEAAINAHSLGQMLRNGFSIPAILAHITKQHGIGACCQAALSMGAASGANTVEAMLRDDPGLYNAANGGVEGTVKLLASRAGTCCRGSLCTSLSSNEKQCRWMGTCKWRSTCDGVCDGYNKARGVCKELTTDELLQDPQLSHLQAGNEPIKRTKSYIEQELKEKEEALKRSDVELAEEEEELAAEREISRLTHAAQALFKEGKFSEAKLYLEEAVRLDQSSAVKHIPGTPSNPSDRSGLADLESAADILDALQAPAARAGRAATRAHPGGSSSRDMTPQILSGIGGPITYAASLDHSGGSHAHGVYSWKTVVRLLGVLLVALVAYITVGFRHGWTGTRVDTMTVELEETATRVMSGGYTALQQDSALQQHDAALL